MSDTIIEDLSEQLMRQHVTSTKDTYGSALEKTPDTKRIGAQSVYRQTEDNCTPVIASPTVSGDTSLRRVDSNERSTEIITCLESQLFHLEGKLRQAEFELEQKAIEIRELQVRVESYEASPRNAESQRQELKQKRVALRTQLRRCQKELENLKLRDSPREMELDGRASTKPDVIHFKKTLGDNLSMKVVISRTLTFTKKKWSKDGILTESCDNAAVACMRFGGRLYIAKAGMTREDLGDFINSNHWTTKAMILAKSVGHLPDRGYATHAEPQLMAFYITRTLQESAHELRHFGDSSSYPVVQSCTKLRSIEIIVSQPICKRCTSFTIKVNEVAKNYGYHFELLHRSQEVEKKYQKGPSTSLVIPQAFIDEDDVV